MRRCLAGASDNKGNNKREGQKQVLDSSTLDRAREAEQSRSWSSRTGEEEEEKAGGGDEEEETRAGTASANRPEHSTRRHG